MKRTRSGAVRLRRPSAPLEAASGGVLFIVVMAALIVASPDGESVLVAMGVALCAVIARTTLNAVLADEDGVRIQRGFWFPRRRFSWDEIEVFSTPDNNWMWGYSFLCTTDGRRVQMRPLMCHRQGRNHEYASNAIVLLEQMQKTHTARPTTSDVEA